MLNSRGGAEPIPQHVSDVNKINEYFLESLPDTTLDLETLNNYRDNKIPELVSFLRFHVVEEIEVLKIISSLRSEAVGEDGVGLRAICLCVPFLLPYITHTINSCISLSIFPSLWKRAIITPLPKVQTPESFADLRPISLLPTLSKILEKILNLQLRRHIEINAILPSTQLGFRPGFGCQTALLSVTDDIISATDGGFVTIAVFLAYSRAFDTVNHSLLLSILHCIGLDNDALSMMSSFLENRQQAVRCGTRIFSWRTLDAGWSRDP